MWQTRDHELTIQCISGYSLYYTLTFRPWWCFLHCVHKQNCIFWSLSLCMKNKSCLWQFILFILWSHDKDLNVQTSLCQILLTHKSSGDHGNYAITTRFPFWQALPPWKKAFSWMDFFWNTISIWQTSDLAAEWLGIIWKEATAQNLCSLTLFSSDFHCMVLGPAPS